MFKRIVALGKAWKDHDTVFQKFCSTDNKGVTTEFNDGGYIIGATLYLDTSDCVSKKFF